MPPRRESRKRQDTPWWPPGTPKRLKTFPKIGRDNVVESWEDRGC